MATRRNQSWATGGNPALESSQNNSLKSPRERDRSLDNPPPPPDQITLLENQVQRLTELLTDFMDHQYQHAHHS